MEMRQLFLSFSIALQVLITFQAICATCRFPLLPPERMRQHQSVIVAKWEETGNRWPVFGILSFLSFGEKEKKKLLDAVFWMGLSDCWKESRVLEGFVVTVAQREKLTEENAVGENQLETNRLEKNRSVRSSFPLVRYT